MNKVAFLPPWSPLPSYEPSGKNNRKKKERERWSTVKDSRKQTKKQTKKGEKEKKKKCHIEQREFALKFVLIKIYFHGS